MALIAMAVWDQEGSGRSEMTKRTLTRLQELGTGRAHRIFLIDNGSCSETQDILEVFSHLLPATLLRLPENVGTAKAINRAWLDRREGELCVKMDNDVLIYQPDWAEQMEEAVEREPKIGIVGLKRKDCWETPWTDPPYRSRLAMLSHQPGQRWIVVEEVNHVIGTCQGYNPALLDKIGYLEQMGGLYGFDDVLAAIRAHLAGFLTVFLPHIEIDHIDPGGTDYARWKEQYAGERMAEFDRYVKEYTSGQRSLYSPPD